MTTEPLDLHPEQLRGVSMLFEAYQTGGGDSLLVFSAMKHLEFWDALLRLRGACEDRPQ